MTLDNPLLKINPEAIVLGATGLLPAIPMTVGISFGSKAAAVVFTTSRFLLMLISPALAVFLDLLPDGHPVRRRYQHHQLNAPFFPYPVRVDATPAAAPDRRK